MSKSGNHRRGRCLLEIHAIWQAMVRMEAENPGLALQIMRTVLMHTSTTAALWLSHSIGNIAGAGARRTNDAGNAPRDPSALQHSILKLRSSALDMAWERRPLRGLSEEWRSNLRRSDADSPQPTLNDVDDACCV